MSYIKITDYAAKDALITGNPAKKIKGVDIGADFDAVAVASAASDAAIAAHIADASDAHAASAITNTPSGNIVATTVQSAIDELDTNKAAAGANTDITSLAPTGLVDLSSGTAGQIKFPATQNASADANTLDDYEEGSWTPTVAFSSSNGDMAYTVQSGSYTKIGRLVHVRFRVSVTETTASGDITVGGLPFNAGQDFYINLVPKNMTSITGSLVGVISSGTAFINVYQSGTGDYTSITETSTATNSTIAGSFSYYV